MKPVLYICYTPYHVLATAARVMAQPHPAQIFLSQRMTNRQALAARIESVNLFEKIIMVNDSEWPAPATSGWRAALAHPLQRWTVHRTGFRLHPEDYAEICIYNDWSTMGRYLQDIGADYTLGEDTYNYMDHPHSWLEEQALEPDYEERRKTGKGYLYWGASRYCRVVEAGTPNRALYWPERQRVFDTLAVLQNLDADQRAVLRRIFVEQELPVPQRPTCLFLPRCFFVDNMVPSQAEQDRFCRDLVEKYAEGYQLYIKPHPRDPADFSALFPQAIVLDRFMPSELLDYCFDLQFDRAVGLHTYSLRNLRCADEIIDIPESALAAYQNL